MGERTEDTTIAQTLDITDNKTRYDEACKQILSEKIILAWIMKTCLEEYKSRTVEEIASQYIESTPQIGKASERRDTNTSDAPRIFGLSAEDASITEQTLEYDIRFSATAPRMNKWISLLMNLEAQNNYYPGYPLLKRAVYYNCRWISAQSGTVFTHSHYEKICKVYGIWLCMNPPKKHQQSITQYSIRESNLYGNVHVDQENYDLLSVIMICIGEPREYDPDATQEEKLLRLLGVIFSRKLQAKEKKQILEQEYGIPMTERVERKVDNMGNFSDAVEAWGIAEGMERGMERGTERAIRSLMENMKLSLNQAMEALNIPVEEQPMYAARIHKN